MTDRTRDDPAWCEVSASLSILGLLGFSLAGRPMAFAVLTMVLFAVLTAGLWQSWYAYRYGAE